MSSASVGDAKATLARGTVPELVTRRYTTSILAIVALFSWFNAGSNAFRHLDWVEVTRHPAGILWPPWRLAQAYVTRDGDEHLYFEYSRLILGEPADLRYIASKRQGDTASNLSQLAAQISARPGLRIPYRDFPLEYPPAPLLMMLAPRVLVSGLDEYRIAFGVLTGVVYLLSAAFVVRIAALMGVCRTQVWRRMAWLALAVGPIVCGRFDILPAALIGGALLALASERLALASFATALAGLTKLYPFLLLIPMTAYLWGTGARRRAVLFSAGVVFFATLLSLPFLVVAPAPFLRSLFLYGARPLQVESLIGSVLVAAHRGAAVVGSFGSFNVVTPSWLGHLADVLFVGAMCAVTAGALWSGRQGRPFDRAQQMRGLVSWTCAAVAAILCVSKVLSPQFLLWLVPLAAVGDGRMWSTFRWSVIAAALTQLYYPVLYDSFLVGDGAAVGIVLTRNAVLVALAAHAGRVALRTFEPSATLSHPGLPRAPDDS